MDVNGSRLVRSRGDDDRAGRLYPIGTVRGSCRAFELRDLHDVDFSDLNLFNGGQCSQCDASLSRRHDASSDVGCHATLRCRTDPHHDERSSDVANSGSRDRSGCTVAR